MIILKVRYSHSILCFEHQVRTIIIFSLGPHFYIESTASMQYLKSKSSVIKLDLALYYPFMTICVRVNSSERLMTK